MLLSGHNAAQHGGCARILVPNQQHATAQKIMHDLTVCLPDFHAPSEYTTVCFFTTQKKEEREEEEEGALVLHVPIPYALTELLPMGHVEYKQSNKEQEFSPASSFSPTATTTTTTTTNPPSLLPPRLQFVGTLRPVQQEAIAQIMPRMTSAECGYAATLVIPPGFGKTVTALHVIAQLHHHPACVLVNTDVLKEQWCNRAKQYLPDARVYAWTSSAFPTSLTEPGEQSAWLLNDPEFQSADILVMTIQSAIRPYITPTVLARFRVLVVDECHHITAQQFSRSVLKFHAYRLGLTATLRRSDKTEHIFPYLLGRVAYRLDGEAARDADPNTPITRFRCLLLRFPMGQHRVAKFNKFTRAAGHVDARTTDKRIQNELAHSVAVLRLLRFLRASPERKRTAPIVRDPTRSSPSDQVSPFWESLCCGRVLPLEAGRILVFAETVAKVRLLYEGAVKHGIGTAEECAMLVGETKRAERERALQARVLFSTYSMCRENVDIPDLQMVVFASHPIGDPVQIVGRVGRWSTATRARVQQEREKNGSELVDVLYVHVMPNHHCFDAKFATKYRQQAYAHKPGIAYLEAHYDTEEEIFQLGR